MPDVIRASSEITKIDLFRNRALICRRGRLEIPAGAKTVDVRLGSLPRSLDDDSMRVRFVGDAPGRIVDMTSAWDVTPRDRALRTTSEDELKALAQRKVELEIERERIAANARLVANIKPTTYPSTEMPEKLAFNELRPATALVGFLGYFHEQEMSCRDRIRALDRELRELADKLQAAVDEIERQNQTEVESLLVARKAAAFRVEVERAGSAEVEVSYVVPSACWMPEYELRVAEARDDAELVVRALVAQRTGENWPQAELGFSTADLMRSTELPKLESWRIGKAQPPKRSGWRELADTTAELFEGFDSGLRRLTPPPTPSLPELPETPRLGSETSVAARSPAEVAGEVVVRLQAASVGNAVSPEGMPLTRSAPPAEAPADIIGMIDEEVAEAEEEMDEMVACEPQALGDDMTPPRGGFGGAIPEASRSVERERMEVSAQADGLASGAPPPPPCSAPAPMMAKRAAPQRASMIRDRSDKKKASRRLAEGRAAYQAEIEVEAGISVTKTALVYANLRMQSAEQHGLRGQLKAEAAVDSLREQLLAAAPEAAGVIRELSSSVLFSLIGQGDQGLDVTLPAHAVRVEDSAGSFAARYHADSPIALAADGQLHAVTLSRRRGPIHRVYACVPRQDTTVYQMVTFENPLDVPLLAGPVRIYRGGDFVVTSPLSTTPPKKTLTVNLGVEPGIAVARNTQFKESTGGLLGGGTNLVHKIELEVRNKLASPAVVQIYERVPKSMVDAIKVEVTKTTPKAEPYDQRERGRLIHNGWRFELSLKPQETQTCTLEYEISISSKQVLEGGNRRD